MPCISGCLAYTGSLATSITSTELFYTTTLETFSSFVSGLWSMTFIFEFDLRLSRYDTKRRAPKRWRIASLVCRTEPDKKSNEGTKNINGDAQKKGPAIKSVESVPMPEESLWWERFVKEVRFEPEVKERGSYGRWGWRSEHINKQEDEPACQKLGQRSYSSNVKVRTHTHTQWTDYSTWTTKVFGKILAASSGQVRSGRCEAMALLGAFHSGAWVNYVHGTLWPRKAYRDGSCKKPGHLRMSGRGVDRHSSCWSPSAMRNWLDGAHRNINHR